MKELFLYRIKQAEKPSKKEKYIRKVMMWIAVDIVFLALAVSLYNEALHTSYTIEITRSDVREGEGHNRTVGFTPETIPQSDGMGVDEEGGSPDPLAIIKEVFGEKAEAAEKIARCESQLNPERIGDEHLTSRDGEEIIGRSIGLFQIRTGGVEKNGKVWNRAKANGMTVKEFEKKMMNPEENIKYAKKIYDRAGFNAWYNCKNKVL